MIVLFASFNNIAVIVDDDNDDCFRGMDCKLQAVIALKQNSSGNVD